MDSSILNANISTGAGNSAKALHVSSDILSLAKEVLPKPVCVNAETYASMLAGLPIQQEAARLSLINVLLPPPKYPLHHLSSELYLLPRRARRAIPILGDYLDMLTKAAAFEKRQDKSLLTVSFSKAIDVFAQSYPDNAQLAGWISSYNNCFYRDGNLDVMLPSGRVERRFTSREVVLCLYITRELADSIKSVSPAAKRVSLDQPLHLY